MHLAPTEYHEQLRVRLRARFRALMPDGPPPGDDLTAGREILRAMGAEGLLGLGWPEEYGGQGRGPDEQFIFFDEANRAGAPISMVTLNTVGPTLMKYGTAEQKDWFLPRILSGELVFAIGYSEPEAGTDLAALRTRAVRSAAAGDAQASGSAQPPAQASGEGASGASGVSGASGAGDDWIIDGQKIFTSNAQDADWIWLACRTDPEAPKHQGISILLVPTDAPGFSWTPIETVGGIRTTVTHYDGIRVPASGLVGEEGSGWGLITNQLNHERVALAALGMHAEDFFAEALHSAKQPDPVTGERRIDRPWVRSRAAETYARLAANRLLSWRLVGEVGAGTLPPGEASGVKFAGTESAVETYRMCQEIAGQSGLVRTGSPGCLGDGELERMNRAAQINTFGGGVSEVQREIVATMRLGLRRGKR